MSDERNEIHKEKVHIHARTTASWHKHGCIQIFPGFRLITVKCYTIQHGILSCRVYTTEQAEPDDQHACLIKAYISSELEGGAGE